MSRNICLYMYGSIVLLLNIGRFLVSQSSTQSVWLLGRGSSPSQGRYLHTEQHKHRINVQRYTPLVWESNPRSERSSKRRQFMLQTARQLWLTIKNIVKYILLPPVSQTLVVIMVDECRMLWILNFCAKLQSNVSQCNDDGSSEDDNEVSVRWIRSASASVALYS
jgi:hypothetical protein